MTADEIIGELQSLGDKPVQWTNGSLRNLDGQVEVYVDRDWWPESLGYRLMGLKYQSKTPNVFDIAMKWARGDGNVDINDLIEVTTAAELMAWNEHLKRQERADRLEEIETGRPATPKAHTLYGRVLSRGDLGQIKSAIASLPE